MTNMCSVNRGNQSRNLHSRLEQNRKVGMSIQKRNVLEIYDIKHYEVPH